MRPGKDQVLDLVRMYLNLLYFELSYLGEAEIRVPQLQALVSGGVEVRLSLPVGDERAVHFWGGHIKFVLLEKDQHEIMFYGSTQCNGELK